MQVTVGYSKPIPKQELVSKYSTVQGEGLVDNEVAYGSLLEGCKTAKSVMGGWQSRGAANVPWDAHRRVLEEQ
jgi:hypothetical protein